MKSASKTAAYGLFSALVLALTVTGEPNSAGIPRSSISHDVIPAPTLELSDRTSTTGFYGISWELPAAHAPEGYSVSYYMLEEREERSAGEGWALRYSGPDEATTLTGIPDGEYTYRVRAALTAPATDPAVSPDTVLTAWSPPASIEVRHHSLAKAFGFLLVGAVVFLGTLVLIVTGHRRSG